MVWAPAADHDGAMNETTTDSGGTDPQDGPAGQGEWADRRQQARDLDRLRRSSTDQYVAGVAGGLGRHFGVDPTILRVLFVVLTFFGGAGLLVYGAIWLLVPDDTHDKAPINVAAEPRKLLLLGILGIAFLLMIGDAFGGFGGGWVFASIAIVVALVLAARDRSGSSGNQGDRPPTAPPSYPATYQAAGPVTSPASSPVSGPVTSPAGGPAAWAQSQQQPPAPPAWQPPPPTPPAPPRPIVPPRPKRTGVIWFWPTLALIAIGLGILGIVDTGTTDVPAGAYPALAVGITGLMLILGSITGRPGGLILIGAVSTFTLSVTTVLGGFNPDARTITATPTTAAAVATTYDIGAGRVELDLTEVADPEALAGRDIDITLGAGEIVVIVPRSLNLDIDAHVRFAGGIRIPGYDAGAFGRQVERSVSGQPASTAAPLELDLELRVGQITVEHR